MLYDRWRQIAREHGCETALFEAHSRRRWTFAELSALAEKDDHGDAENGGFRFPRGSGAEFILDVLKAWRRGAVVCPLEPGQEPLRLGQPPPDIVHLKTTSATTGAPRLVAFTGAQLAADADNIVATMGLRREWPNLGVISLAHSYGFSNLVLPLLLHGIPLILCDAPLPESVRRAAGLAGEVTLPAVPALWRAWLEARAIPDNVRLAISAGAPLPLLLEAEIHAQRGLKIHNFYGATECGGIAFDAGELPRTDPSAIGAALRGVQLSVNEHGCLEVRGQAVGSSYWPVAQPGLGGGCYRTSDLAELREGTVFLRGRASDQINVAGRKVSPESIERVLMSHPGVRDCLVFGAPSPEAGRGEIIAACVVAPSKLEPAELRRFLLAQLPAWQVPREWRFVESLSPNQRGKLSRAEWRARLGFSGAAAKSGTPAG